MPILSDQVAGVFLPWDVANAQAIADGADEFDVTLKGNRWTQKPQKYHARSLGVLKAKYAGCGRSRVGRRAHGQRLQAVPRVVDGLVPSRESRSPSGPRDAARPTRWARPAVSL